jgi:hypothetical protein
VEGSFTHLHTREEDIAAATGRGEEEHSNDLTHHNKKSKRK